MSKLSFWVYELLGEENYEDWADKSNPGTVKTHTVVLSTVVLDDCSDNLCIGGTGKDGKYYQYDSYEGWHAASFFAVDYTKHGLSINCYKAEVEMKDVKVLNGSRNIV